MSNITIYYICVAILLAAAVTYFFLKRPNKTYTLLTVLALLVIIWLVPFGLLPSSMGNIKMQTWLMRVSNMAAAWHPALVYFVISSIINRRYPYKKLMDVLLVVASAVTCLLDATPYVIESVDYSQNFKLNLGTLAVPLAIFYGSLYLIYPMRFFIRYYPSSRGKERIQMKYLALGLVIAVIAAFTTNTILPVFFENTEWYIPGSGFCLLAVGFIFYGFNEEKLYDLDLLFGPLFRTNKYRFHLMLRKFITELPMLLSYEKIAIQLSQILNCRVGIELVDSDQAYYAQGGQIDSASQLISNVFPKLKKGEILRREHLPLNEESKAIRNILDTASIASVIPLSDGGKIVGLLALGHGSIEHVYSSQDFEQLLHLCEQLTITSKVIRQKEEILGVKEMEITRLSEALEKLKPALMDIKNREKLEAYEGILDPHYPIIGSCPQIRSIMRQANQVAKYDTPVLILGETGTGKENIARYIHKLSGLSKMIAVNCSAIPENLIESELFGYKKGAFTGADRNKTGLIVEADGGVLFLDEVGDLPLPLQAKLLRVLQDGYVQPLGDVSSRHVNVRLIAATNCDLKEKIRLGGFREDLYHRISVIQFTMPALSERGDDLLLLANFYLDQYNKKYSKNCLFSANFISQIQKYKWPGNIRELENRINRLVCLSENQEVIQELDVEEKDLKELTLSLDSMGPSHRFDLKLGMKEILDRTKKELIISALETTDSQKDAAELLGLKPSNFSMYLKKFNIKQRELH